MNKFYFSIASLFLLGLSTSVSAKTQEVAKYQRSSLHMAILFTDEAGDSLKSVIDSAWTQYPTPDKYNSHDIPFQSASAGSPKGSIMATVAKYANGELPTSIPELKELKETLTGSKYQAELEIKADSIVNANNVARQMVAKWYGIKEDGSYDANFQLISERGCYNANQLDVMKANRTQRGVSALMDAGEDLISNTFLVLTKISACKNEPIAALTRNLTMAIASQAGSMAMVAAQKGADKLYDKMKDGYTVYANTILYQLDWNEDIKNQFYACFGNDGKIDMAKFNALPLSMKKLGSSSCNSTIMWTDDAKNALTKATIRNIDKILAQMQKDYDPFKPVCPIVSTDPVLKADMGMKEGLEGGEKFEVLEPVMNPETNKVEYKSIATVKVDKKGVWDNRYDGTDKSAVSADGEIQGTVLSNCKKATPGMLVKQVK